MATDEERLLVRIEAQLRQFERAMGQATRSADKAAGTIERRFKGMERTLAGIGKGLGSLIGVTIGVGAFRQLTSAITDTVHAAAGLVDLADKIGITTDALQELRFQAGQQGSSAEALDAALEQFSKRIGEAAAGSGELLKILQANGVALRDASGSLRPLTDLLADYADLIKNAANDQDRAVLATQAFGKAGDEMASVLRGGSQELETFKQKAHELNQVVGEEGLRTLESYDDRLAELQGKWNTAWTEMTVLTLEALEKIGQAEHFILDPIIDFLNRLPGTLSSAEQAGAAAGRRAAFGDADARINQAFDVAGENIPKVVIHPKPLQQTIIPHAGGGRAAATHAVKEQRDSVADLIAELQRELQLVGATDAEQRVSNELRRAGADATDAQKQQITDLVNAIEQEEKAQQAIIDRLDEIRFAAGSALDSFVSSIENGEGAAAGLKAALTDILHTIIQLGEQKAISALFGQPGAGGGGFLGSLFGSFLPGGGGAASALSGVGTLPSAAAAAGGGAPVVQLQVVPGQMFVPVVTSIAGKVSVQAASAAESRAVARGPAVARNQSRRYGTA